jgi:hypothetical protein
METYEIFLWISVTKWECDHSFPHTTMLSEFVKLNSIPLPHSQGSEQRAQLGLLTMKDITIEASESVMCEV